jgi:hypothetical protein
MSTAGAGLRFQKTIMRGQKFPRRPLSLQTSGHTLPIFSFLMAALWNRKKDGGCPHRYLSAKRAGYVVSILSLFKITKESGKLVAIHQALKLPSCNRQNFPFPIQLFVGEGFASH